MKKFFLILFLFFIPLLSNAQIEIMPLVDSGTVTLTEAQDLTIALSQDHTRLYLISPPLVHVSFINYYSIPSTSPDDNTELFPYCSDNETNTTCTLLAQNFTPDLYLVFYGYSNNDVIRQFVFSVSNGRFFISDNTELPYQGVSYHDWLFVAIVIVAMLAFMIWPRIFKPIKTLFYGE
jgi:hypothetical protein